MLYITNHSLKQLDLKVKLKQHNKLRKVYHAVAESDLQQGDIFWGSLLNSKLQNISASAGQGPLNN